MNALLTTIAAILIFAVLIFVHEFGHFLVAKLTKVKVNEFALGMGPRLFSKQFGETVYSIRLFPIGGFCAMEGEDGESVSERAFSKKKPLPRLAVLVAGAFMNILLGFVLLCFVSSQQEAFVAPVIEEVVAGGAAEAAGMRANDEILSVNGRRVHINEDLMWELSNNQNQDRRLDFKVKNNGEVRTFSVLPKEEDGNSSYGLLLRTEQNSALATFKNAFYRTGFYSRVVIDSFLNLVRGKLSFSDVSGPVGIVSEIGSAVEDVRETGWEGFVSLMYLTILLTINLGVFNLLPIPALDGGRILFVLIELIRRKPIPVEKEAIVHFIGFALLILLSVLIAFQDVFKLFG